MAEADPDFQLRRERDGYKHAYEITAEELGSARGLIDRYQQMFEALAAERLSDPAPPPSNHLDPDIRAFLIIGNGRTGSTWLLMSADQLPDVVAQREIKWRAPGSQPHRGIAFIDGSSRSMRDAIAIANRVQGRPQVRAGAAAIAGGKLIFDPYGYNGQTIFAHLDRIIERDVKLIALRRSYLEWWLSWKARGVYHDVDIEVMKRTNSLWEQEFAYLTSREKPRTREIVLTAAGAPLTDTSAMNDPVHYPLRDAVDDMFMAFSNDLFSEALVRSRGGLCIDYAEIGSRYSEFADFIGTSSSPAEIDRIAQTPVTRKLDALTTDLVRPTDILVELDDILRRGLQASEPVWTWRERRSAEIRLPGLAALLRKHGIDTTGASYGIAAVPDPDVVVWQARKPIYTL